MDAFVPFFQTALWVGLIIFLVLRFHTGLNAVLDEVKKLIGQVSQAKTKVAGVEVEFQTRAKTADLVLEQFQHALPSEFEKQKSKIEESIRKAFVRVNSIPFLRSKGQVWDEPYDPATPVWIFLNRLWNAMQPHVAPYTYGKEWILRDKQSGEEYPLLGRAWPDRDPGKEDTRSLEKVGIVGGSELEIIHILKSP